MLAQNTCNWKNILVRLVCFGWLMTYACGTNFIIEYDEQVSPRIDKMSYGDDNQKGNASWKVVIHEDLNILPCEIEHRNLVLSRDMKFVELCWIGCSRLSNKPMRNTFAVAQHMGYLWSAFYRKSRISRSFNKSPEMFGVSGHFQSIRRCDVQSLQNLTQ